MSDAGFRRRGDEPVSEHHILLEGMNGILGTARRDRSAAARSPVGLVTTVYQGVALTVGQGGHAWHRMEVARSEALVVAAPRDRACTHTSSLQIRRS